MTNIEIEYYEKDNDVLLILTGIGGSTKGYQNKYEQIAKNAMKLQNLSVVVATSPYGSWLNLEQNLDFIMNFIYSKKQKDFKIYAMGNSVGANILLWYSNKYPQIQKVLAINPVMNVNLHMFKPLQDTKQEIIFILGELDMSSKFVDLIPKSNNIKVHTLPNIDHIFTNNLNLFINLPTKFLY